MTVSEIATRMIEYSKGNIHDINHFMNVYAYAKTIGECEELDRKTQEVLADSGCSDEIIERILYLIGHHHTLKDIAGMDYQILIEADYLVNADECNYSEATNRNVMEHIFKTKTGIYLLKSIYGL